MRALRRYPAHRSVLWVALLCVSVIRAQTFLDSRLTFTSTAVGSGQFGSADGEALSAQLDQPYSIALSPDGNTLAIADHFNELVRLVDITTLPYNMTTVVVSTIAGGLGYADGVGTDAKFTKPKGVHFSPDGARLAVCDSFNNKIRLIDVATRAVMTLAGSSKGYEDGRASISRFNSPFGVAFHPTEGYLLVSDSGNHALRKVITATGETTTLAGDGLDGFVDGTGSLAKLFGPRGVTISSDGVFAVFADTDNNAVRRVELASGAVSTIAGGSRFGGFVDASGSAARFNKVSAVAIMPDGAAILAADTDNNRIRRINSFSGDVTTLAGNATAGRVEGTRPTFNGPLGIIVASDGAYALVSDTGNHIIRIVQPYAPPPPVTNASNATNALSGAPGGRLRAPLGSWGGMVLTLALVAFLPLLLVVR